MAIYQDLADRFGYDGRYNSVKRFVRRLCATEPPEQFDRLEFAPGEEVQVDYGQGHVLDLLRLPASGWPLTLPGCYTSCVGAIAAKIVEVVGVK